MTMCNRLLAVAIGLLIPVLAAPAATAATAANGNVAYVCENEQYYTDICVVNPATGEITNLTDDSAMDGWPSWSPDGTRIAYHSDNVVHVMNADGTDAHAIVGSYGDFTMEPAWSPDGRTIAFVSTVGDTDYEIYTVSAEGEAAEDPRVRLTTTVKDRWGKGVDDYQPTWSPDSSRIAFVSQSRTWVDACDIYVMDAADRDGDGNGDNLQRLTYTDSYNCSATEDVNPAWSPTGEQIAYSSVETGDAEIWVMNSDGTDKRNLTRHSAWDWMPGWSPDGTQVTFTSGRDGDEDIYSVDASAAAPVDALRTAVAADATGVTQLTHNDTPDRMSDWGADLPPETTITTPKQGQVVSLSTPLRARGTATDPVGVASVRVALRQTMADGRCRWWNGSGFATGPCGRYVWRPAPGTEGWSWPLPLASMQTTSVKGVRDYRLYATAVDAGGTPESAVEFGRNAVAFKVGS
jgi:Tol biopolymer transport system component